MFTAKCMVRTAVVLQMVYMDSPIDLLPHFHVDMCEFLNIVTLWNVQDLRVCYINSILKIAVHEEQLEKQVFSQDGNYYKKWASVEEIKHKWHASFIGSLNKRKTLCKKKKSPTTHAVLLYLVLLVSY